VSARDNVATVVEDLDPGDVALALAGATELRIVVRERIPFGHKVAIAEIPDGGDVVKYGERIGTATSAIPVGTLVHVHNVVGCRATVEHAGTGAGEKRS